MSGINGTEFVVIALIVMLVVGPEKLPEFAAQLGRIIRELKKMATGAKASLADEFGADLDELRKLDPRQYDPRRIVREALADDDEPKPQSRPVSPTHEPEPPKPAPFDNEAT